MWVQHPYEDGHDFQNHWPPTMEQASTSIAMGQVGTVEHFPTHHLRVARSNRMSAADQKQTSNRQ
jgi:hypothetical protein